MGISVPREIPHLWIPFILRQALARWTLHGMANGTESWFEPKWSFKLKRGLLFYFQADELVL